MTKLMNLLDAAPDKAKTKQVITEIRSSPDNGLILIVVADFLKRNKRRMQLELRAFRTAVYWPIQAQSQKDNN